ncbi:MAG TPA: DUF4230 domain-containing protein [Chloroflexi bacterium]|nr:DUF4230 domain-containing protein [Chloroflexota bacterium]
MGQDETPRGGFDFRRLLVSLILLAILLVILIGGYLAVDTILTLRRSTGSVPRAVGTQVQQVLHPTPTLIADPVTIIRQVRSLSRLETASFTIEKVITAESGEGPFGFLFRDRLLLVAQGQVIAGVDLSRMGEEDIQVVGTTVFVTLPAAEIFVATLNNDNTYVYDRQTALLGQQVDLETLARQEAEREILQAALEGGILEMARDNAEQYIGSLIRALGFEEVVFVTATPAPDQDRGNR